LSNKSNTSANGTRRPLFVVAFILIGLAGITLRIYPSASFTGLGYDEGLYRGYVTNLIDHGLTSYPDFAENYVETQQKLPAVILPPTRFLYIFSAYLWHEVTGADALLSLHRISCLFSILLLFASAGLTWRLAGPAWALGVFALMSCAPTQIHMAQHALIDGFFAFWATMCLWFLWENFRKPNDPLRLTLFAVCLALMVLTKENAVFAYVGLFALLAANRWLHFGTITRTLLLVTVVGPLAGLVILIFLCGSAETFVATYRLVVSKASVLPYAIATGDGPWYRYLVDLLLASPVIFLLAWAAIFRLKFTAKPSLYLLMFVVSTYLLMCNIRYGMNLRYTNMWDLPLRYLALGCLVDITRSFRRREIFLVVAVLVLCAIDLRQYFIFFVQHDLYELITAGLLRALQILK
jgi:4-amino-4-deoxy-L-arabinose transferase-like glycosyltransferase